MVCRVFFFKQKTACEVRISGRSSDVCSSDLSASWLIQAIDPLTGEVLQDATRGLLAPNNASGAGAGFVSYSVRPSDDVATGAGISASARVLLDGFAPAATLVLSPTVDGVAPESRLSTPAIGGPDEYRVDWSVGVDNGGGGGRHRNRKAPEVGGGFTIKRKKERQ